MKSEHQQVSCSDSVSEMTGRRQAGSQSAIKKLCGASIPYQEFPIPYIEVVIEITLLPVYVVLYCTILVTGTFIICMYLAWNLIIW